MSFYAFVEQVGHSLQEQTWYVAVLGVKGYADMLVEMWHNARKVSK